MTKRNMKPVKQMKVFIEIVSMQYPKHSEEIIKRALKLNQQMCAENSNQPREVLIHTRDKIYPTISIYKSISEITGNKESAYRTISNCFTKQAKKANRTLQILCHIPFIYKLVPLIMSKLIHIGFGKKSGFDMIDYPCKKGKCHIDMIKCPYFSNCEIYQCTKLCTAFCNADDIAYGNMHPKLFWGRTQTLAKGNECCNFIVEISGSNTFRY